MCTFAAVALLALLSPGKLGLKLGQGIKSCNIQQQQFAPVDGLAAQQGRLGCNSSSHQLHSWDQTPDLRSPDNKLSELKHGDTGLS